MKGKKEITVSLSTFFLIIAIFIIGIMGVFIYNLDNEQKQANSKIEELNAEINNTQENVNNINTVVNETESVNEIKNSTEKDIKLDINSEQIQLLYKYIPAMNTNKIEVNAYQNKKINYIVKVKNKKKTMYVVCNKKLKKVDTFEGETISKKEVKNAFVQKYQVNPTKVEIGYENDQFVYCLTYKGKDTLLYAFYSLDNGEFLKAYKL